VYCGQTVGCIKMKLGMQVGLGPGHIVLDGDTAPLPKREQSPQFSAHVYRDRRLHGTSCHLACMEVELGLGHIVLDGDTAPPPQKGATPQYSAHICCGQVAGWIKMPLGREVGLSPSDIVLDGDPAPLPQRGGSPQFSAQVYCGQTA